MDPLDAWEGIGHCALGFVVEGGESKPAKRRS